MNTYEEQIRDNVNQLEKRVRTLQRALIAAFSVLEGVQAGRIATNGGDIAVALAVISAALNEQKTSLHNSSSSVA